MIRDTVAPSSGIDAVFAPHSVAIVGASSDARRFGGRPIQYLLEAGFEGPIYPINPARETIQGLRAYRSLEAIDVAVDCAMISVSTADTIPAVQACADKGVKAAILFGNGFAEMGDEGQVLQDRMVGIARDAGMRLLGPNCMGLVNPRARFYATFASALEEGLPAPGRIAVASQSGGYGGYVMKHMFMRGLGLGPWVTTGNESDIKIGEVLHWMARQDDVDVILAYLEGLRGDDDLVAALRVARDNGKPVIAMKVGRTAEGTAAAVSHTASLTGSDRVYDAVFEEFGVHRARTSEEMLDLAYAFAKRRQPAGRKVGVISISGGVGVQIADYVSDAGLQMATVPQPTQQRLREIVANCSPRNPIDMTGLVTANHHLMTETMDAVFESNAFDSILLFLGITGMAPSQAKPLLQALETSAALHPERMVVVCVTAPREILDAYDRAGFVVMEDPSRAIGVLAALTRFGERRRAAPPPDTAPALRLNEALLSRLVSGEGRLNEVQAKQILAACDVPVPKEGIARDASSAAALARDIGFPVALKVVSADLPHKSQFGGVALNLASQAEVADAVQRMQRRIANEQPQAQIDGFLVSEMVTDGMEWLVGIHRDPDFGPVVTLGAGGVLVELLQDTVCRRAPVTVEQAQAMIARLRSSRLLQGYRGDVPRDIAALAQAVSALSRLAASHADTIEGIEVNPLVVRAQGRGVMALDAVVQMRAA